MFVIGLIFGLIFAGRIIKSPPIVNTKREIELSDALFKIGSSAFGEEEFLRRYRCSDDPHFIEDICEILKERKHSLDKISFCD